MRRLRAALTPRPAQIVLLSERQNGHSLFLMGLRLYSDTADQWNQIAGFVGTKTAQQVKSHFSAYLPAVVQRELPEASSQPPQKKAKPSQHKEHPASSASEVMPLSVPSFLAPSDERYWEIDEHLRFIVALKFHNLITPQEIADCVKTRAAEEVEQHQKKCATNTAIVVVMNIG